MPRSSYLQRRFAFMCQIYLALWATYAKSQDESSDNTVIVVGRRNESTPLPVIGHGTEVEPTDASRFTTIAHIKRDSSVIAPETGRISASGFVVPSFRGQDSRLTDVYADDLLIQDPYTGLPVAEDIDLRAFGILDLYFGVAPLDIPGTNPIGTVRYRSRPITETRRQVGQQIGRPFGAATWGFVALHSDQGIRFEPRVYGRLHTTDGRYPYYDDNGTPYNEDDDRISQRENNDRRSYLLMPRATAAVGLWQLSGIGLLRSSQAGIPGRGIAVSNAHDSYRGAIGGLDVKRELGAAGPFSSSVFSAAMGTHWDERSSVDPGGKVLVVADESKLQIRTNRAGMKLFSTGDWLSQSIDLRGSDTRVQQLYGERESAQLRRRGLEGTIGLGLTPFRLWKIELKKSLRQHLDQKGGMTNKFEAVPTETQSEQASGQSAAVGLVAPRLPSPYVQYARTERLPSLLEQFGDGASVRPADDLTAETTTHREFGVAWKDIFKGLKLGFSRFEDETSDKVIFVPAFASGSKALNVRRTRIQGEEFRADWLLLADTELHFGMSRLGAFDETRDEGKRLPGVPDRIVVIDGLQRWAGTNLRWMARYRSEVFRDLENTVISPGAWIHDANVDRSFSLGASDWAMIDAGVSVQNVFDVNSTPVEAPGSPENRGRTGWGDVQGYPLPGRQWVASLAAKF